MGARISTFAAPKHSQIPRSARDDKPSSRDRFLHPRERQRGSVSKRRLDIFDRLVATGVVHRFSAEHGHELDLAEAGGARFLLASDENLATDSAARTPARRI